MRLRTFGKLIIAVSVVFLLCQTSFVLALEIQYPDIPGAVSPENLANYPAKDQLGHYVNYLYHFSLIIGVLVALAVITYGGISYLTSGGMVAKALEGRKWISAGLIGLFILLGSWVILFTINPQLITFAPKIKTVPKLSIKPPKTRTDVVYYRELPVGQLVEKILKETKPGGDFQKILDLLTDFKETSKNLTNEVAVLKKLTDNCKCGIANCATGLLGICAGSGGYGLGTASMQDCNTCYIASLSEGKCNCEAKGCQPAANCDKSAIAKKIREIGTTTAQLDGKKQALVLSQISLMTTYFELRKAVFLMQTAKGVIDYYGFLRLREEQARTKGVVVEAKSFAGWPGVLSQARIGLLETIAKESSVLLLNYPGDAKNFSDDVKKIRKWVEKFKKEINQLEAEIDRSLLFYSPSSTDEEAAKTTQRVGNLLSQLESFNQFVSGGGNFSGLIPQMVKVEEDMMNIVKNNPDLGEGSTLYENCKKLKKNYTEDIDENNATSTMSKIKERMMAIKLDLSSGSVTADCKKALDNESTEYDKLGIRQYAEYIKTAYLNKIIGQGSAIADPATFYFLIGESSENR